jgi:hypothetical protein
MKRKVTLLIVSFLFIVTMGTKAQSKWEFGYDVQLKKNLLLRANENSSTPERYEYGTGYINPQFEVLANYRVNSKWKLSTGIGVGYESHYCEFTHGSSGSQLSEIFTTRGRVYKIPLRGIYHVNTMFDFIMGGGINLVDIYATRYTYNVMFSGGGASAYESEFISDFTMYPSGSLSLGGQYNGKKRISWFILGDLELNRYPEVSIVNKYQDHLGNQITYSTMYRAHFYSIAIGMYYRIYPKEFIR